MESKFIAEKEKLIIDSGSSVNFIDTGKVIFCEQQGEELAFYLSDHSRLILNINLKELSALLDNSTFVQIGDKYLINLKYLEHIPDKKCSSIGMALGYRVPVNAMFKKMIVEAFTKSRSF